MKKLLLPIALIVLSCSAEDSCESTPKLTTSEATEITDVSATVTGTITPPTCDETVTSQGFVYGESELPTIDDTKIVKNGSEVSATLSNLEQNKTYYVRTFFENPTGIYYGNEINFNTNVGDALLQTNNATNITASSASISGRINSNGGGTVILKGFCYSTEPNPTVDDLKVNGAGSGNQFNATIENLIPDTIYYLKAYAENESGIFYGQEVTFETMNGIIQIETLDVTNVMALSINCGGRILSSGGADIIEYGFEFSVDNDFSQLEEVSFQGYQENFSSKIEGLKNGSTYFIKAYAENFTGRFYGEVKEFNTESGIPNLQLEKIFNLTTVSAVTKVNVIYDGGIEKNNYGVCWSENNNPTIEDSFTYSDDEIMYTFIKNLTPNKRYYVRAFLNNEIGTSYSDSYEIQTLSSINIGDAFEGGVIVHIVGQDSEFYKEGMINGLIAKTSSRQDGVYRRHTDYSNSSINTSESYGSGLANTIEMFREAQDIARMYVGLYFVGAINLCNDDYFSQYDDCGAPDGWYYYDNDKEYDWFIPSLDELMKLYHNYDLIQHHQNQLLNGLNSLHWTSSAVDNPQGSSREFYSVNINDGSIRESRPHEQIRIIVSKYF